MSDDRLFGFHELQGPGDAQFWLDHTPSQFLVHEFSVEPENASRRRAGGFQGIVHVKERLAIEEHCQRYELLYERGHDIWYTGSQLICGTHGTNCCAIIAVEHWMSSGCKTTVYYPRVTWDGRIFLAGACTISASHIFQRRLE